MSADLEAEAHANLTDETRMPWPAGVAARQSNPSEAASLPNDKPTWM